ncbi:acyltransferase domain-containing protein [Kribbella endophytica]
MTASDVGRRLGLSGEVVERLAPLSHSDGPVVELLSDEAAERLCARLGIERVDRDSLLTARPDEVVHPELWWVLDRSCRLLLTQMGQRRPGNPAWSPLPDSSGPVGRHLFVWAFLAIVPHVRDYHATIGLSDDESWDSLSALGGELAISRRLTGRPGLDATWGLPLVFTGAGFRLGRLAFERQPRHTGDGDFLRPGESALNTHVPSGQDPLTDEACDASFARALELVDQFPEQVVGFACHSWLMDTQLTHYLPATANIVRFQRRFTTFTDRVSADWAPIEHLFHRRFDGPDVPGALLDQLPQRTTLQRAIVTQLRQGGHWYNQTGWVRTGG